MKPATDHRARQRQREAGRTWARSLRDDQVHTFSDEQVLGYFDWRCWFDKKPTSAFLRAAFDEAQMREELSTW